MTARRRRWILAGLAAALAAALVWAGRDWIETRLLFIILESGGRVEDLQVDRVIATLAIEPGEVVADIGAGTGLFTRPMARAAGGSGRVYAVDINRDLLLHVETTAKEAGLETIRTVLADEDDPRLPEPVDLVLLCDTLHHIAGREAYLRRLRAYLKPGGRVAIIDFHRTSPHLFPSLKYAREDLAAWMESAGYALERELHFVTDNFFLIYRCDDCPDAPGGDISG